MQTFQRAIRAKCSTYVRTYVQRIPPLVTTKIPALTWHSRQQYETDLHLAQFFIVPSASAGVLPHVLAAVLDVKIFIVAAVQDAIVVVVVVVIRATDRFVERAPPTR